MTSRWLWVVGVTLLAVMGASTNVCPDGCRCYKSHEDHLRAAECTGLQSVANSSTNLQVLILSRREIKDTTVERNAFRSLPALQYLVLNNNSITNIKPGAFQGLRKLIMLDLSNNGIRGTTNFTSLVTDTPHLRELILRGNPLIRFTSTSVFITAASITYLDLRFCGIQNIPDVTFKGLSNLKTLLLDGNHVKFVSLSVFPDTIHYVSISRNLLQDIDASSVSRFEHLKKIDLSENPLHCSCELWKLKTFLFDHLISTDPVRCIDSSGVHRPWTDLNKKSTCGLEYAGSKSGNAEDIVDDDIMLGDSPYSSDDYTEGSGYDSFDFDDDEREDTIKTIESEENTKPGHQKPDIEENPETSKSGTTDFLIDGSEEHTISSSEKPKEVLPEDNVHSNLDATNELYPDHEENTYHVDGVATPVDKGPDDPLSEGDDDFDEGDMSYGSEDEDEAGAPEVHHEDTAAALSADEKEDKGIVEHTDGEEEEKDVGTHTGNEEDEDEDEEEETLDGILPGHEHDGEEGTKHTDDEAKEKDQAIHSGDEVEDGVISAHITDAVDDYDEDDIGEPEDGEGVTNSVDEGGVVIHTDNVLIHSSDGEIEETATTQPGVDDSGDESVYVINHVVDTNEEDGATTEYAPLAPSMPDTEKNGEELNNEDEVIPAEADGEDSAEELDNADAEYPEYSKAPHKEVSTESMITETAGVVETPHSETVASTEDKQRIGENVIRQANDSDSTNSSEVDDDDGEESGDGPISGYPDWKIIDGDDTEDSLENETEADSGSNIKASVEITTEHHAPSDAETDMIIVDSASHETKDTSGNEETSTAVGSIDEIEDFEPFFLNATATETENENNLTHVHTGVVDSSDKDYGYDITVVNVTESPEPSHESTTGLQQTTEASEVDKSDDDSGPVEEHIDRKVFVGLSEGVVSSDEPTSTTYHPYEDAVTSENPVVDIQTTTTKQTVLLKAPIGTAEKENLKIPVSVNEVGVHDGAVGESNSTSEPRNTTGSFIVLGCILAAIVLLLVYSVVRTRIQKSRERRAKDAENPDHRENEMKEMKSLINAEPEKNEKEDDENIDCKSKLLNSKDADNEINEDERNNEQNNKDSPSKPRIYETIGNGNDIVKLTPKNANGYKPSYNVPPPVTDVVVEKVPEQTNSLTEDVNGPRNEPVANGEATKDVSLRKLIDATDSPIIRDKATKPPTPGALRVSLREISPPVKQTPIFITNKGQDTSSGVL